MIRSILHGKIHRATVTGADIAYEGSIEIDRDLLDAADMRVHEMVHVFDIDNGERFVTYIIEGPRGSGNIVVNGAAARKVARGDKLIIIAFAQLDEGELEAHKPHFVWVDDANAIARTQS